MDTHNIFLDLIKNALKIIWNPSLFLSLNQTIIPTISYLYKWLWCLAFYIVRPLLQHHSSL